MEIKTLLQILPQVGRVDWIGLRAERRSWPLAVSQVEAVAPHGLVGDHYQGSSGARAVTLIQAEHLAVVAQLLGRAEALDPHLLRRNIVVAGINLLALKNQRFKIGEAILEATGECHPCSRMEEQLGAGGYNAMRGHGGITARVVAPGLIRVGDAVALDLD